MLKRGTTTIILNGTEYTMSFNFGVLKFIQKHTKGMAMGEIFDKLGNQDLEMFGLVAYYGIKMNHKDFEMSTIDELQLEDITNLFLGVGELLQSSIPTAIEDEDEKK